MPVKSRQSNKADRGNKSQPPERFRLLKQMTSVVKNRTSMVDLPECLPHSNKQLPNNIPIFLESPHPCWEIEQVTVPNHRHVKSRKRMLHWNLIATKTIHICSISSGIISCSSPSRLHLRNPYNSNKQLPN
jgi:hypothetical protein